MENFLAIENCKFEIDMMESDLKFTNKLKMLEIQLMESTITDEVYTEGVVETITNFFEDLIEKIKKMFTEARIKIKEKMLEAKLQKMCKEIKQAYAKNKSAASGKKIKYFDYKKYYKDASKHISDVHNLIMKINTKKFKSMEELREFEYSYTKNSVWNNEIDIDQYYFDVAVINIIGSIDTYAKNVLETMIKLENEILKAEEEAEKIAAEEEAREKVDEKNISKTKLYKKIGNKLCQCGKKISSYLPYAGYRTLSLLFSTAGAVSIYNALKPGTSFTSAVPDILIAGTMYKGAEGARKKARESLPNK